MHYRRSEAEGKIPKNVNFNSVQSVIFADGEIFATYREKGDITLGTEKQEMRGRRGRRRGEEEREEELGRRKEMRGRRGRRRLDEEGEKEPVSPRADLKVINS